MSTKSTLTPPAPLDLGRLEAEAKAQAAKHVANLLQRPDQLEKIDQLKRRVARKKASVEAMLKTAVQSQLDGVRTGLNQLQSALQDVYEIKQGLDQVEEIYKSVQPLREKLKPVRDENTKFSQLAAAVENLKHIFTVPESVRRTEELINDGKLLQAHKHLSDLESSRDDLLFELHKQPNQSPTDRNTLNKYFADVLKLSESLGKQLWIILQRALMTVRREPTLMVTALRIIEREERIDDLALKRKALTGFMPPGRPKCWREKCFKVLQTSIEAKIEGNQFEDRSINKMWLVRHLEVTRQLMVEDLKVVKSLLPPVFPPEYNIVKRYVQMYHRSLSQHLKDMIGQELEGNEIVSLLTWVNSYESPELMKHPELNINTSELGPLLEPKVIDELQNQYLRTMRLNISEWTGNTLRSDQKDWHKDEEPDTDGDGYFNTSLPVIVFQMLEQNMQVAQIISQELVQKVLEIYVEELDKFAQSYTNEITVYKENHLRDRSMPRFFLHYMIGNTNNCMTFGDYMKQLRRKYLKNEYDTDFKEDEADNIRKDKFQMLTERFMQIAKFCCEIILGEVFIDLKSCKVFTDLLTRAWMSFEQTEQVDVICATWADYNRDFVHLKPQLQAVLTTQGKKKILTSYLEALLSRKLSFKNYDERRKSAEKICREADQLNRVFQHATGNMDDRTFDVLTMLAEVIKLKDSSMLSLEIMGLVKQNPDIRLEQLINLLLCRGDLSRSEARQMAMDSLGDDDQLQPKPKGVFTDVVL